MTVIPESWKISIVQNLGMYCFLLVKITEYQPERNRSRKFFQHELSYFLFVKNNYYNYSYFMYNKQTLK